MARDVHWCVTVDYQQIEDDNIANQIHGFTMENYGKFILKGISHWILRVFDQTWDRNGFLIFGRV